MSKNDLGLDELITQLSLGETQELEFKRSVPKGSQISRTATAMANTNGGWILLGVTNEGDIVGISGSLDEAQKEVSEAIQCVSPIPQSSIQIKTIDKKTILAIKIEKSSHPIFHTFEGAIYQRHGTTNRRLDGMSQLDYLRNHHILSFDEGLDSNAELSDLEETQIQRILDARNQSDYLKVHRLEQFLLSQKLVVKTDKIWIKNATIVLMGKNPCDYFPQAEIKLVQFADTEAVQIVAYQLIKADLPNAIDQAHAFVLSHISKKVTVKGDSPRRQEDYEYPPAVIREAIVNAVAHRDYFSSDAIQISLFSDRLEILSPGGLPEGLPEERFGTASIRRNPIIYRILRDLRYIEGLGTGIPRIKNEMRQAGLPDPKFMLGQRLFQITLLKTGKTRNVILNKENLNTRQQKGLTYLISNPILKAKTYATFNHVSSATAHADINELVEFGFLKKVGSYRGAHYVLNQ